MPFSLPNAESGVYNFCYQLSGAPLMPRETQVPKMFSIQALRSRLTVIACVGLSLILPAQVLFAAQRKRQKPPIQQVQTTVPASPPVELTPAQKPAVPPQVTYHNGELTIIAENCTIGDVMRAVHSQTGAVIDLPPNASERVASRVGPGAPRDVLVSLLNGSDFNYVLLGSTTDPKAIQHIILTTKEMGAGSTNAMANAHPNMGQPGMMNPQPPGADNDGSEGENNQAEEAADEAQDDQAETPADAQAATDAAPQGGVKTPQQLLQELQRQQVLQQQQQGQPQSAGPQSFPQPDQPNQVPPTPPQD